MKTWIKGGLIGLSVGLVFGSWALFNYTLAGGSSQVWFEILIFSPIIKFVDNLLVSIGLTDQNVLGWIINLGVFYGIYFAIGALVGYLIEVRKSKLK